MRLRRRWPVVGWVSVLRRWWIALITMIWRARVIARWRRRSVSMMRGRWNMRGRRGPRSVIMIRWRRWCFMRILWGIKVGRVDIVGRGPARA
ncbi:hypothetical protein BC830DRAFT_28586 [Chytriomyces sp. MP71]|nr:hypothetical protein BC830DRAFT_28586 [Chytriomyces sp. MP71]